MKKQLIIFVQTLKLQRVKGKMQIIRKNIRKKPLDIIEERESEQGDI